MALDDLKATLDRSFADQMWSKDGMISRAAWETGKAVVMGAGMLKTDVKYDEIIDMSFVESLRASRFDRATACRDQRIGVHRAMSEPIWNQVPHRARQGGVRNVRLRRAPGLRQASGAARHRRELCVLRRAADADPGVDQALAQFLRRGRLGRHAVSEIADREGAREGHPGDLHHRRAARRQLGQRKLELEEQPLRRGPQPAGPTPTSTATRSSPRSRRDRRTS